MGYTFTLSELASDLGTSTGDGLRNIANTAANFVCDAYENYANATTNFNDPTGIGKFNNALFSSLCSPRGKEPDPPTVPFTGGQCSFNYNVSYSYTDPVNGNGSGTIFNVPGPITGIKRIQDSDVIYSIGAGCTAGPGFPGGVARFFSGQQVVANRRRYTITSVVRSGGGPDTCGDPAPQFPDAPLPPTAVTNNTTNVNIGAGVIIPVGIAYAPVDLDVDINAAANIQVDVGPFNVSFDLGGVNIRPNFNINVGPPSTPSPGNRPPSSPSPKPIDKDNAPCYETNPPVDLTPVLDAIADVQETVDDVKECSCPVGYDTQVTSLGGGRAGVAALPSNCIAVRLTLTEIPSNAKVQNSDTGHPDFFFCGYYDFGDGSALSARTPLSVESSYLEKPLWATSFGWSLYNGYNCTVTALSLVPEKPGAQLASVQMKVAPA